MTDQTDAQNIIDRFYQQIQQIQPGERPARTVFFAQPLPTTASQSIALGTFFATGGGVSGIIKLIAISPTGTLRVVVEDGPSKQLGMVCFPPSYLFAEALPDPDVSRAIEAQGAHARAEAAARTAETQAAEALAAEARAAESRAEAVARAASLKTAKAGGKAA